MRARWSLHESVVLHWRLIQRAGGDLAELSRQHSLEAKATRTAVVVRCHSSRSTEMLLRSDQQFVRPPRKTVEGTQAECAIKGAIVRNPVSVASY